MHILKHSLPLPYWWVRKDWWEKELLSYPIFPSFCVIEFDVSSWWLQGNSTSKKGYAGVPWSFMVLRTSLLAFYIWSKFLFLFSWRVPCTLYLALYLISLKTHTSWFPWSPGLMKPKHRFQENSIKNFKMAAAEHKTKPGACLNVRFCATAQLACPQSQSVLCLPNHDLLPEWILLSWRSGSRRELVTVDCLYPVLESSLPQPWWHSWSYPRSASTISPWGIGPPPNLRPAT